MLDINVLKEMYRLEFIDDVEETRSVLVSIITDPTYVLLSRQYWTLAAKMNAESSDNGNAPNITESFEDPTRAYHPMISIYYLTSEMLDRKHAKIRNQQQRQSHENIEKLSEIPESVKQRDVEVNTTAMKSEPEATLATKDTSVPFTPKNSDGTEPPYMS